MENVQILEGTDGGVGGLIIRKKKNDDDDAKFVAPKLPHLENRSLLGLDILAAKKEKEREEASKIKETTKFKEGPSTQKNFRRKHEETPSHTGGVADEAKRRRDERKDKERDRGFYVSSKDNGEDLFQIILCCLFDM